MTILYLLGETKSIYCICLPPIYFLINFKMAPLIYRHEVLDFYSEALWCGVRICFTNMCPNGILWIRYKTYNCDMAFQGGKELSNDDPEHTFLLLILLSKKSLLVLGHSIWVVYAWEINGFIKSFVYSFIHPSIHSVIP